MGDDYIVRIEKLSNGFEVEIRDHKQAKKNSDPKGGAYKDPWQSYAFKTTAQVCKFLEDNLDKAIPEDDYATAFDAASADEADDEEEDD